ncbi:MAG: hypothetical protein ACRD3Q_20765 [Terriglobales bacterium]
MTTRAHLDTSAPGPWRPNAFFAANALVRPASQTEAAFVYQSSAKGQSGKAEPKWPTRPGDTIIDGSLIWRAINKYDFRPWLLYGATTQTLIPWEWISESRDSETFMNENERAKALLRAVNGDSLTVEEWHRFCGARLQGGLLRMEAMGSNWERQRVPLIDEAKLPLRAALEAAMREAETAISEIQRNSSVITDSRVLRVLELSKDGVPRDRVIAHSIGPALIFALSIIVDRDKPYRRLLRQCEWPSCGNFAFDSPPETPGQPPNYYCSDKHQLNHRRERAKERQAAHRAGVSVEAFRSRARRRRSS